MLVLGMKGNSQALDIGMRAVYSPRSLTTESLEAGQENEEKLSGTTNTKRQFVRGGSPLQDARKS
jgi:hypothetical protein